MNWKKRAREALGKKSERLMQGTVEEIVAESETVTTDLPFLLESAGATALPLLAPDCDGLRSAEKAYRSLESSFRSNEGIDRGQIERLLGVFLGRVLIEQQGGEWVFYLGKYHTLSPVVIRLASGKHADVLGFCHDLYADKRVDGARRWEALVRFHDALDLVAFP